MSLSLPEHISSAYENSNGLKDNKQWCLHDLSNTRYVYFLAYGINSLLTLRQDDHLYLVVITAALSMEVIS
ncbi:MAG: hypothetical protein ACTS73_07555 [Arsenophonus sp. NEOnobi-MAG3]